MQERELYSGGRAVPKPGKENGLLASLTPRDRSLLQPHLTEVNLDSNTVLFEAGAPITHVYFPHSAVVSLLVVTGDGCGIEAATIGNEGVVGLGGLLAEDVSFTRQVVQLPGRGAVIERRPFLDMTNESQSFRERLAHHTDRFVAQVLQSAACHALHAVEQRLARWLLQTDDRWEGAEIPMTQDVLATALGVRRSTISLVANTLQSAGLITYRRGRITIENRAGLERFACECYGVIRELFQSSSRRS